MLSAVRSERGPKIQGFDASLFLQLLALDAAWIDHEIDPILRSRDPNDDPLLSAALNGRADYLVSGDLDLLELASDPRLGGLRILTPRAFLEEFQ